MEGWVKSKIPNRILLLIFIFSLLGFYLLENLKTRVETPWYQEQVSAAETMLEAMGILRVTLTEKGIDIPRDFDPNQTGLIGIEFSELTTTTGFIDAKRTAANPDFAALMVKYFRETGLKKGDYVGIGGSGSFPSLILATISAAKTLELNPIIIYSVGASMYGANIPDWTFIDMLDSLNREGIFSYEIAAVSMGGIEDRARGFFQENHELMENIMQESGSEIIFEENLVQSIERRKEIYREKSKGTGISCFVNIGGASANYGTTLFSLNIPPGLIRDLALSSSDPERGLIFEYSEKGIPVIHLLNIRYLATKNGIPIDPIPLPPLGTTGVYFEDTHSKPLIILFLLIVVGALGISSRGIFIRERNR